MSELWRKLRVLFRRERFERELAEEMQSHLEMQTEENQQAGMDAQDARYAARRQFGNATLLGEASGDTWGWGWLERIAQDLKYAARLSRKNPAFTSVALLTLALGIGANTVIFSVVRAVVLAPLPYRDPDRLVMILGSRPRWGDRAMISGPNALDIRAQSTVFDDLAIERYHAADLTGAGDPEHLEGCRVTPNLFPVLGVAPALGRGFVAADAQTGAPPVVILSHALWRRRFGGDALAIGKTATLEKQSATIVGVMPPWFHFPSERTEYWIPLPPDVLAGSRGLTVFHPVARLKPGATLEQANAEIETISDRLVRAYPAANTGWKWRAAPITASVVGGVRPALLTLFGAVGMVLLIACANVANLLQARGAQRRQELALRAALGAGRKRLARLLLGESLLLSLAGGLAGAALSVWGVRALAPLYPPELPRTGEIQVNAPVLAFTLLVSLATALLVGLLPAIRLSRIDLNAVLKSGTLLRSVDSGRARAMLVVVQVGLAVVLLTCAGLLLKSFLLRTRVSGFDPENVLTVRLSNVAAARLPALLERIRAIPGVRDAAATTSFSFWPAMGTAVRAAGRETEPYEVMFDVVTPDFLRVLRVPLRRGRFFTELDNGAAPAVAVINETMARRVFAGEESLGKQIITGRTSRTVVGVVGDVPFYNIDRERAPAMYLPYLQFDSSTDILTVRTAVPPAQVAGAVRGVIHSLEPDTPILRIETIRQNLSRLVASERFYTLLLGIFAALALGLAALGVYGVVSFATAVRTHEIGVRMALGADRGQVLKTVMRQGALVAAAGSALGIAAAFAAARVLLSTRLLFRVQPADPLTFACVPLALLAVALLACWIPARRATKIDPMEALRYE